MAWKRDWLNIWRDKVGDHSRGNFFIFSRRVTFRSEKRTRVRMEETARSGAIVFETYAEDPGPAGVIAEEIFTGPKPLEMTSYGSAQVYLLIRQGSVGRFLSAPLATPIELRDVDEITLVVLAPLPARLRGTRYVFRTNLNAHFVFSVSGKTTYEFGRTVEGTQSNPYLARLLASGGDSECFDL